MKSVRQPCVDSSYILWSIVEYVYDILTPLLPWFMSIIIIYRFDFTIRFLLSFHNKGVRIPIESPEYSKPVGQWY